MVPLKGGCTFKRGPSQGFKKNSNFLEKLHQKFKLALTRPFLGRFLSVIPIRKPIDCTVAGGYCKKTPEHWPMRNELLKVQVLKQITQVFDLIQKFFFQKWSSCTLSFDPDKKNRSGGHEKWVFGQRTFKLRLKMKFSQE